MATAIITDLNRCVGCLACATACKGVNNVPIGNYWNKVVRVGPNPIPGGSGDYPDVYMYFLPISCQHCENPECVKVCPTGASHKLEDGTVQVDKEKCIGCMTCEKSCPYGHPVQLDDGLSHKCVLCSDENPEGVPDPTCAKACPVRALEFGTLAELRERHPEGVSALGELTDETAPAVVFAPHRDAAKGGVLHNPQEVSHEA